MPKDGAHRLDKQIQFGNLLGFLTETLVKL
jgi:hypothetical protein